MPVKGGGKGGNMPVPIEVKITQDGEVYCVPDPAPMSKGATPDKRFKWTCKAGEFTIKVEDPSPFEELKKDFRSADDPPGRQLFLKVKDDALGAFVYTVEVTVSSRRVTGDPGLIIKP
jgi:hypothetical protein